MEQPDRPFFSGFWDKIPPWLLLATVAVLFPVFAVLTAVDIHRQKEIGLRLLSEKGAALIRAFEAGARTGMRGGHGTRQHLQNLLRETALQEDIVYLLVTDTQGRVLASGDQGDVGRFYATDLDLEHLAAANVPQQRMLTTAEGLRVLEIYRKFTPLARESEMRRGSGRTRQTAEKPPRFSYHDRDTPEIIFVGLDMVSVEEAHRADMRHTLVMAVIMLLAGLSGILLLFIIQAFQITRKSLTRVRALSNHVLENMPVGLLALDPHYRLVTCNRHADRLLQLTACNALAQPAVDTLPPDLWRQIEQVDDRHPLITREINCRLPDDSVIPLEISIGRMLDEQQQSLGIVLLFKDLREIKALREAVARSRHLASLGRMAAGVAHEIRNPLSSIKGLATFFKQRYRDVPDDQQTATLMIQEVERLNRVVSQLLEFARPIKPIKQLTVLNELIADSLQLISAQAQQQQVEIIAQLPAKPVTLRVDPDSINQLLLNLFLNAMQAMENGGQLTVGLDVDPATQQVCIHVRDTGKGIAEADLPRIFDPYFTTRNQGTGLGLAIVHNIVEAHNGSIRIESQPAAGTLFSITLDSSNKP